MGQRVNSNFFKKNQALEILYFIMEGGFDRAGKGCIGHFRFFSAFILSGENAQEAKRLPRGNSQSQMKQEHRGGGAERGEGGGRRGD